MVSLDVTGALILISWVKWLGQMFIGLVLLHSGNYFFWVISLWCSTVVVVLLYFDNYFFRQFSKVLNMISNKCTNSLLSGH